MSGIRSNNGLSLNSGMTLRAWLYFCLRPLGQLVSVAFFIIIVVSFAAVSVAFGNASSC